MGGERFLFLGSLGGQQGLHFSQGLAGPTGFLEPRFVRREEMHHSDLCSAVSLKALPEDSTPAYTHSLCLLPALFSL